MKKALKQYVTGKLIPDPAFNFAEKSALLYLSNLRLTRAQVYRKYLADIHVENLRRMKGGQMPLRMFTRARFDAIIANFPYEEIVTSRYGQKEASRMLVNRWHRIAPSCVFTANSSA
ncbi:hypothetical protein [Rhizobium sp.]|uniref:hypothetical protein n=1 Tax=Rhizobium sp. TaxID=391 RepID=UPI00289CE012